MKNIRLIKLITIASITMSLNGFLISCGTSATSNVEKETTINNVTTNIQPYHIDDIKKIEELEQLLYYNTSDYLIPYEDVTSLLGEAEVNYPNADDKALKVAYWYYNDGTNDYTLDTLFYENEMVNMQLTLVESDNVYINSTINDFDKHKDSIYKAKNYNELVELVGEGVKGFQRYGEYGEYACAWKANSEVLVAYIQKDGTISHISSGNSLYDQIPKITSCY